MLKTMLIVCGQQNHNVNYYDFSKVRSSQSEQNFEDILNANNVSAQEMSVKSVPNTPAEESAPDI